MTSPKTLREICSFRYSRLCGAEDYTLFLQEVCRIGNTADWMCQCDQPLFNCDCIADLKREIVSRSEGTSRMTSNPNVSKLLDNFELKARGRDLFAELRKLHYGHFYRRIVQNENYLPHVIFTEMWRQKFRPWSKYKQHSFF
jgi:hypothetical protein